MAQFLIRNRLRRSERISDVSLHISVPAGRAGPPAPAGVTDARGLVQVDTSRLRDGRYTVQLVPAHTSAAVVGPGIAAVGVPPARIYRSLDVYVRLRGGRVTSANLLGGDRDGAVRMGRNSVVVDLQPVWMRSPNHRARGRAISMILVHHTGGPAIGPAVNWFLSGPFSAHYLIDTDGLMLKMVQDSRRAYHAGVGRWHGSRAVNSSSIGIEVVHNRGAYPEAQYTALLDLLAGLRAAYPGISADRIVGHSDVATDASGRLGRKSGDPGSQFQWSRLESRSLGLLPAAGPWPTNIYGGFFDAVPNGAFRRTDKDGKRVFGGANRPAVNGDPVQEIQQDLTDIGYSLGTPDGDFGWKTHWAGKTFQEHFFAGGRGHKSPDGQVDLATAQWIKRLAPP